MAEVSEFLVRCLGGFSAGSVEVDLDSKAFASVDAQARNVDLQIGPLLSHRREFRLANREEGLAGLFRMRGVPSELALRGWRVALYDGSQELLSLGRGTSAVSGHIHIVPSALWKLRKLV
ncbi:MAG: hypothetical protein ACREEC_00615 [Thermoplasmata archaeon]